MAEDEDSVQAEQRPAVEIRYLYLYCNDLLAMRRFYTELVGMQESSFRNDDEWAWLCYKCHGFEFMIFPDAAALPQLAGFAMQPGWPGGTRAVTSWSVHIPETHFIDAVMRMKAAGVPTSSPQPQWAQYSYWSFPVLDPMGNMVELYSMPSKRPAIAMWPD